MTKLNYDYISPLQFLNSGKEQYWDYRRLGYRKREVSAQEYYLRKGIMINPWLLLLLAPFQPLVDSGKDAADTFKPYECWDDFFLDLAQPIYGIANVALGLTSLFLNCVALVGFISFFVIIFPTWALIDATEDDDKKIKWKSMDDETGWAYAFAYLPSGIIESIVLITRGITQIAATPLTYLFKIPLRTALFAFTDLPYAEDKPEAQRLAIIGHKLLDENKKESLSTAYSVKKMLEIKMSHAKDKGKKIRSENLAQLRNTPQAAREYFERFYSRSNAKFSHFAERQSRWAQESPDTNLVTDGNYSLVKDVLLQTYGFYSKIKQPHIEKFHNQKILFDQKKNLKNSESESKSQKI